MREATVQRWMTVLLQRAERVGEAGEVPVAAVVLDAEGRCIGNGRNRRETGGIPLVTLNLLR